MIYLQKKICLSCKKYRLQDPYSGLCRIDKNVETYPITKNEDTCDKWLDGGQQYYIRMGWIRTTLKKEEEENETH